MPPKHEQAGKSYKIDRAATAQFVKVTTDALFSARSSKTGSSADTSMTVSASTANQTGPAAHPAVEQPLPTSDGLLRGWTECDVKSLVRHATKGFLRGDLYSAMTVGIDVLHVLALIYLRYSVHHFLDVGRVTVLCCI